MSAASTECILFAGPSAAGTELPLDGVEVRPPAGRGDIAALIETQPARVVALADGVFHQALAVGHAELRNAVECGWQVWGLSSLGAIRACEMRNLGVRGYGDVYRRFVADQSFSDDEVALLHAPDAPYQPISEPLIHLRAGLQALEDAGTIAPARRRALVTRLKKMWYGDRTLGFVRAALVDDDASLVPAVDHWLASFRRYRVKSADLQRFLEERPWRAVSPGRSAGAAATNGARTRRIRAGQPAANRDGHGRAAGRDAGARDRQARPATRR